MVKNVPSKKTQVNSNKGSNNIRYSKSSVRMSESIIYEGSTGHIAKDVIKKYDKAFEQLSKK